MQRQPVVLIAFEEQDNLGTGYIASVLRRAEFPVHILDFRLGVADLTARVTALDPLAVGFSVIFQFHIDSFRELMAALRRAGVTCHFTAGGHYPSLRPAELLRLVPELDSVVLFDGEFTARDLMTTLAAGEDWRAVHGLAYRAGEGVLTTPLRPLEPDLDVFPPPVRQPLKEYAYGKKYATLLAGRGCVNHCSFCSIREFYRASGGPIKRVRRPEMVVREMELLHTQLGCDIFMFQDDDFPITMWGGKWLAEYCRLLDEKRLAGKVLWKINCRVDELTPANVAFMKAHGLFLVYLGIESGTDEGLGRMEKRVTAEDNLRATALLNAQGVLFDYGFMIFDPGSTFATVRRELDFLDRLGGDGRSPVTFCKMLPFAGTTVERTLKEQGRLIGPPGNQDYHLCDPRLDDLFALMADSFATWIGGADGLLNLGRWTRHFLAVHERTFGPSAERDHLAAAVRRTIGESNRAFTALARRMADLYEGTAPVDGRASALRREAESTHAAYSSALEASTEQVAAL